MAVVLMLVFGSCAKTDITEPGNNAHTIALSKTVDDDNSNGTAGVTDKDDGDYDNDGEDETGGKGVTDKDDDDHDNDGENTNTN